MESSAQESAADAVQNYGYRAIFPILLDIEGQPTYFMSLYGDSYTVKGYALVNLDDKTIVGTGLLDNEKSHSNALNAAVEISYLGTKEQVEVHKAIESEDGAPSIEQAKKIRRFFDDGKLNPDVILSIMQEEKPEKIKITLGEDKLKKYFPKGYTKQQIEAEILRLLENAYRKKQHGMER